MAKLLIIDDDPDIVLAIRMCLEAEGHQVLDAANTVEGLAKIKADRPDLIILDVMMDTTTEGFGLALKLRSPDPTSGYRAFSKIPILMLTAIHSTTPLRFGPEQDYLPVDDFVEKPVEPAVLAKKIKKLLEK